MDTNHLDFNFSEHDVSAVVTMNAHLFLSKVSYRLNTEFSLDK